jgi:hypothetical protein
MKITKIVALIEIVGGTFNALETMVVSIPGNNLPLDDLNFTQIHNQIIEEAKEKISSDENLCENIAPLVKKITVISSAGELFVLLPILNGSLFEPFFILSKYCPLQCHSREGGNLP